MKYLQRLNLNWKNDFYSILEKHIVMEGDFQSILSNIPNNIPLSKELKDFFKEEGKNNFINIKDDVDADEISYYKDNGKNFTIKYKDRMGNTKTQQIAFNKLLQKLGYDTKNIPSIDLKEFMEYFLRKDDIDLKEVTGNAIKEAYLESNYDDSIRNLVGTQTVDGEEVENRSIFGSCMRHKSCQNYLDIYTKNPNQVSCLVLKNSEGKVQGRALIWNTDDGFRYLDTIYSVNKFIPLFQQYAKQNNIRTKIGSGEVTVTLDKGGYFDYYPYMDTFMYYTPNDDLLSNKEGKYELRDQYGGYTGDDEEHTVWSDYHNYDIPQSDAILSVYHDSYMYKSEVEEVIISIENDNIVTDYIHEDEKDDVFVELYYTSKKYEDYEYALKDISVKLEDGDYILEADTDIYEEIEGSYYIKLDKYIGMMISSDNFCIKVTWEDSEYYDNYIPHNVACTLYEEGEYYICSQDDINEDDYEKVKTFDDKKYPNFIYTNKDDIRNIIINSFKNNRNIQQDVVSPYYNDYKDIVLSVLANEVNENYIFDFTIYSVIYNNILRGLYDEKVINAILNNKNNTLNGLVNDFTYRLRYKHKMSDNAFKTLTSNKRFLDLVIKRDNKEVLDILKSKGVINERKRVF